MNDPNIKAIREVMIEEIKRQKVCIYGEFAPSDENGKDDYDADPLIGIDGQVDFNALAAAVLKMIRGRKV